MANAQLSKKTKTRLLSQQRYLDHEFYRYKINSSDIDSLATLKRLNDFGRNYNDELVHLSSSIPPMKEQCKFSAALCCFREEANIINTLESWTLLQKDKSGNTLDTDLFEILLLINRPRINQVWDKTFDYIEKFKSVNKQYNIHPILHTFCFPEKKERVLLAGKEFDLDPDARIGLVFKLITDLALMRNMQRSDDGMKANHLIATSGGDTYSRNPIFIDNTLAIWSDESVDFIKIGYGYPRIIAEKYPLIWVLHEFRMYMAQDYHKEEFIINHGVEREVIRRHGVFRAGLYSDRKGFNPKLRVAEDLEFGRSVMLSNAKIAVMENGAVDNPRRSLSTVLSGGLLIEEYNNFGKSGATMSSLKDLFCSNGQEHAQLDCDNLSKQITGHFQHYIKLFRRSRFKDSVRMQEDAFAKAKELLINAFLKLGVDNKDIDLIYGPTPENCYVRISENGVQCLLKHRDWHLYSKEIL